MRSFLCEWGGAGKRADPKPKLSVLSGCDGACECKGSLCDWRQGWEYGGWEGWRLSRRSKKEGSRKG